jgi:hypothetical protein
MKAVAVILTLAAAIALGTWLLAMGDAGGWWDE